MQIERLTPEQERKIGEYVAEWYRVGTCTDRADRTRAESAIAILRHEIGAAPVRRFVWCESPATGILAIHALGDSLWDSLRASLRASLGASLGDSIWDSLKASLGDSLRASLGASLWDSLWDSLRDSLRDSLWASLRDSLGDSLWNSLRASLGDSLWDSLGGQYESYWIAHYLFCRDVVGVTYDARRSRQLDAWAEIARSCCWWWCYGDTVIACERPTVVRVDDRRRLHCEDGPAMAFADGWQIHSWHGVRVPQRLIEQPEMITAEEIDAENNAEIRRVMVERYGLDRYMSGAAEVHRGKRGVLLRREVADDEPIVMVRVENSTAEPDGSKKTYLLRVPPEIDDADAAIAWTAGLGKDEYNPKVET